MFTGRPQVRLVCGGIIALLGVLWVVQGLDLLGQDGGMNGEEMWVVIGAIAAVLGGLVAILGARGLTRQ